METSHTQSSNKKSDSKSKERRKNRGHRMVKLQTVYAIFIFVFSVTMTFPFVLFPYVLQNSMGVFPQIVYCFLVSAISSCVLSLGYVEAISKIVANDRKNRIIACYNALERFVKDHGGHRRRIKTFIFVAIVMYMVIPSGYPDLAAYAMTSSIAICSIKEFSWGDSDSNLEKKKKKDKTEATTKEPEKVQNTKESDSISDDLWLSYFISQVDIKTKHLEELGLYTQIMDERSDLCEEFGGLDRTSCWVLLSDRKQSLQSELLLLKTILQENAQL